MNLSPELLWSAEDKYASPGKYSPRIRTHLRSWFFSFHRYCLLPHVLPLPFATGIAVGHQGFPHSGSRGPVEDALTHKCCRERAAARQYSPVSHGSDTESTDTLRCFKCGVQGHQRKNCPMREAETGQEKHGEADRSQGAQEQEEPQQERENNEPGAPVNEEDGEDNFTVVNRGKKEKKERNGNKEEKKRHGAGAEL
ncbi:UNVERIFIED_CONTAM: hypothetical protein FKN15_005705 [Acipenser sinensis]